MYLESFVLTFTVSLLLYIIFIPILKRKKACQTVRLEGPSLHYSKNGTPTFGGVIFVFTSVIVFLFYGVLYHYKFTYIYPLIYPLIIFSLIGFLDDGLITKQGKNNGLNPKLKLFFQIFGSVIFSIILYKLGYDTKIDIFDYQIELGYFYYLLVIFMIVGSSNAFNLTDGIDGLSGGSFVISAFSIILLSIYKSRFEITIFGIILMASVLGYLCFNCRKAKIFMGDSGSLSLGAVLASIFILMEMEILLVFIGIIYIIETLSVIIQVIYFKITRGKRIFKMTPIHHHFEIVGLSEMKIDYLFWLIEFVGAVLGVYLGMKYY